jgi:hypothetical protein
VSIGRNLLAVSLCALLTCCNPRQMANTAHSQNANKSESTSANSLVEQFGDEQLWDQLNREQGIEKPFAWERWGGKGREKGGTVIGIDQKGTLKEFDFFRTDGGYVVKPSEPIHKLNVPIRGSGDLELTKYLPDTEFPFRAFVVPGDGCNVHFVLVWQALNRSFEKRSLFLDAIHLRVIVEKDGMVVSNGLQELLFETLGQTLAEDVNKDGRPDFLVIGSNMSTSVRIWTVAEGCVVKTLLFREGDHFLESVGDKGLSISKNKKSGAYDVRVTHYEPITKDGRVYFEVTETIYQWDPSESVYKVSGKNSRLK